LTLCNGARHFRSVVAFRIIHFQVEDKSLLKINDNLYSQKFFSCFGPSEKNLEGSSQWESTQISFKRSRASLIGRLCSVIRNARLMLFFDVELLSLNVFRDREEFNKILVS